MTTKLDNNLISLNLDSGIATKKSDTALRVNDLSKQILAFRLGQDDSFLSFNRPASGNGISPSPSERTTMGGPTPSREEPSPVSRISNPSPIPHSLLFEALKNNDLKAIQEFILSKGDVNATNERQIPVLLSAAFENKLEIFEALLKAGAAPHFQDPNYKYTALILAAHSGNEKMLALLIDAGVDLNCQNDVGATALMAAAQSGSAPCVEMLLTAGANRWIQDFQGLSAKDYGVNTQVLESLSKAYPNRVIPKVLYQGNTASPELIAEKRRSPLTGRVQMILRTQDGKVEKIYHHIMSQNNPAGGFKTCKPVLQNDIEQVRLVMKLNNAKQGGYRAVYESYNHSRKVLEILGNAPGIAQVDFAIETENKQKDPTIDIYQKKYRLGDLNNVLTNHILSQEEKMGITRLVALGLKAMHDKDIAHCDIKPANILVDSGKDGTYIAALSDFDLCALPGDAGYARGTISYFSPEMENAWNTKKTLSLNTMKASDIWALGITLMELWAPEFAHLNHLFADETPHPIIDLVFSMTNPYPEKRVTITQVLKKLEDIEYGEMELPTTPEPPQNKSEQFLTLNQDGRIVSLPFSQKNLPEMKESNY